MIINFLVNKRVYILGVMLILAVASIFMMQKVNVNSDMTKYLPDNSLMKKGIDKMNKEFSNSNNYSFKIMFENLTPLEKEQIDQELSTTEGVASVNYDLNSETYNKDNYTLYIINTTYENNSSEAKGLLNTIKGLYEKDYTIYTVNLDNDAMSAHKSTLDFMIPVALVILILILLLMCASWFEPVLFIFTIAVAVLINMGTNVLLPSVSNMTFSIAAIMQLVLSMDYSIILMNRYRQEKAKLTDGDKVIAMKNAMSKSFKAIISSSGTTIVGLLALIFMNFKIGEDMGVVFAKGVFISLIAIFTVLPTLILWSDQILTKTLKKSVHQFENEGGVKNA